MPIPGNHLRDNWYMGTQPVDIKTLADLRDRTEGFTGKYKLSDSRGNNLTLRIGDNGLIIEPYNA